MVAVIPDLIRAVSLVGDFLGEDLSFASIRKLLSVVTSSHLQAAFQIRPFIDLLQKQLPVMISTLSHLRLPTKTITTYGVFRHEFTNEFGRAQTTLLTRSKIVMDTSSAGLLSAVLGVDALGILPKASNLWDILPFTFVVNWFAGIGASIRRTEYSLLLATVPAYFVHSYTLTSPLSAAELDLLKMSSASPEPSSLRVYLRDVNLLSPVFRDTRFGFGIPTSLPSLGTLGSLLYQTIFG
jgi:hypothetical protein